MGEASMIVADKEVTVYLQSDLTYPGGSFTGIYQGDHDRGVNVSCKVQGRKQDVLIPWDKVRYITQDKGAA
jgi:hypothetical protein